MINTSNAKKWPAMRIVYLHGGLITINKFGPDVEILPRTTNGGSFRFTLSTYGSLYSKLQDLGFFIIGTDFFASQLEIDQKYPPEWRMFHRANNSAWVNWDVIDLWNRVGHGAFLKKDGKSVDLASRISHQLKICAWRLKQIAIAYRDQLNGSSRFRVGKV